MLSNQSLDFALASVRRSEILRPTPGWSSGQGLGGRVAHEFAQLDQISVPQQFDGQHALRMQRQPVTFMLVSDF